MDPVYNQFCLGCLAIVTREVLMIFAADLSHLKVTFRGNDLGRPEVCEEDVHVRAEQNIFWLQVPVYDVQTVQVLNSLES